MGNRVIYNPETATARKNEPKFGVNDGYYIYRHIRPDNNEPFYIGIGTKLTSRRQRHYNRALTHVGRNSYWRNIANKHGFIC